MADAAKVQAAQILGRSQAWAPPDGQRAPLIQVSPMGNLGNRMIQYMAALSLAARVPGARLVQVHLPEWGIQIPPCATDVPRSLVVEDPALPLDRLADALQQGALDRVDIRTYAQRMANFLPPGDYRGTFRTPSVSGAGSGELLCNIRQGDILDAHHPDYVLIPLDFYASLMEDTGLSPVFLGQLDDTPYMAALRQRFRTARYVPSQGAVADFAYIRASCHIVPAISTFSWLAAWLSEAETVHLPVLGLFNPAQSPSTDLLPFDDPRYRFTQFPHHYAVPVAGFAAAHGAIDRLWRSMKPAELRALMTRVPPPRDRADTLAAFDEAFYLRRYADIASTVASGDMPDGRHHFEHYGFNEGRVAFGIDAAWYCTTYPIAAIELGERYTADPADHWVRYGKARGYKRSARESRLMRPPSLAAQPRT